MTEEAASTPGWVDERLDRLFSILPQSEKVTRARQAYLMCLATQKTPATPSDLMGAEFSACRAALHRALQSANVDSSKLDSGLEALEADIATGS